MERRLAAILAADVVDYSRLMERAEEATAARLAACHGQIAEQVAKSGGRVFNRAGDAALAEFPSPINALLCAVEIRDHAGVADVREEKDDRLQLRFGLHLADVIVSNGDLIGDGINIAARIQQASRPDDVWLSELMFNQVRRQSPFSFEDLGPREFKNISEPIRIYRVSGGKESSRWQLVPTRERPGEQPLRAGSIAVMPFVVSGAGEEQRYLAEGLTEDLIVELARFKNLFVSSRSASFSYEGRPADPSRVGRELGVRYVLDGQVRRIGDNIRMAFRLSNTQTGEAVWAESISRPLSELFDLLDTIVRRIAATVVGRVEAAETAGARRKPPQDMTAYDCLLRGLEYYRQGDVTVDNVRAAVAWFDRAIAADPDYGLAYAWRICAASSLPDFDLESDLHYAVRALELDQNNAEAHRIMGAIRMFEGDFAAGEYHHRRAMELNPSDAYIKARSAAFHTFKGEPDRALQLIDEALTLDPFLPAWGVLERGVAHYTAGRFKEAAEALRQLPLQTPRSRLYQAAALVAEGQSAAAQEIVERMLRTNPDLSVDRFMVMETYRERSVGAELRRRLIEAGLPAGS